jgi:hypothetical protein
MRRIQVYLVSYAEESARALSESWDAFWFKPADPTLLGLIRILTGMMLLYTHAVWGLVLPDFFGEGGWLNERLVRTLSDGNYSYSLWWLVPDEWMWPAYWLSMAVLTMFTVGLWTRATSILAFLITVSYIYRVSAASFGLDQINAMLALYLAIGPSGDALSIDRWRGVRRGRAPADAPPRSAGANLALRLINVHMCVIYFFAGISKLQGEAWWNGEAMWRAFANLEYQSIDMTWMAWHPRILDLLTHVSVLWELSFCALIWRPRLRPLVLAGAVPLHVGIGACLGMWTFGLIMLVGCASFLPAEAIGNLVRALRPGRRRSRPESRGMQAWPEPVAYASGRIEAREPALVTDAAR